MHHSATHLLHSVLLKESGCGRVSLQEGSHIDASSFSFDFYAGFLSEKMQNDPSAFLRDVEKQVNSVTRSGVR